MCSHSSIAQAPISQLHLELLRDPSWKTCIHFRYFYLFPLVVHVHVPLQTFLEFNAIYILIE